MGDGIWSSIWLLRANAWNVGTYTLVCSIGPKHTSSQPHISNLLPLGRALASSYPSLVGTEMYLPQMDQPPL